MSLQCSGTNGRPYDGSHVVGEPHYLVIEPDGTVKRFCESDCLREHYAFLWQQFRDGVADEIAEGARLDDEAAGGQQ